MTDSPAVTVDAAPQGVTVIMPTFNAARTVRRAIDSVLAQTHADWQLVCVDDASTDETVAILRSYADHLGARLVVRTLAVNGGPARARNRGLAEALGEWVAILDADDAWEPGRLARLIGMARHGRADAICDNLVGFDDHREATSAPLFASLPRILDIGATVAAEYQGRYNLGYLKPIIHRPFLSAHGIRYDERLRTGEDLLLLLFCLAHGGRVLCCDQPGYIYTTPVGHGSGKLSRSTTTSPRDADLAISLQGFLSDPRLTLSAADRHAVERRIAYLGAIAPLSRFRHARLNGRWGTALRLLLVSPPVRRRLWDVLRPGRRDASDTWA